MNEQSTIDNICRALGQIQIYLSAYKENENEENEAHITNAIADLKEAIKDLRKCK